ncbi:hypothetical protein [Corynebacterium aquilae]|uniref:hypothetical protein n=1 Tax=Corynebacterium aquilae TaxID=203263 RepID=UPI001FE45DD3|nr:hypothetical protein [Corynebacterium aquilae]
MPHSTSTTYRIFVAVAAALTLAWGLFNVPLNLLGLALMGIAFAGGLAAVDGIFTTRRS